LQFRVVIVVTVGAHLPFWSAPPPHDQPDANIPSDQDRRWLCVGVDEAPLPLAGMG